jgi:membrane protein implicated in regulation of membrane protease activity
LINQLQTSLMLASAGAVVPVWWLRLSDAAVNLAPMLLLAVILLRLGSALLDNDSEDTKLNGKRSQQLAHRWAFVFALLVPLQLIGYAWLWADSDSQLNRQINIVRAKGLPGYVLYNYDERLKARFLGEIAN